MEWKLFTKNSNPPLIQHIKTKAKRDGTRKLIGFQYSYFKFDRGGLYAEPGHQKEFMDFVKKRFKENPKLFFDILEKEKKDSDGLIRFSENVKGLSLRGRSNAELLDIFNEFSGKFEEATAYLIMHVVMDFAVQERLEAIIKEKARHKDKIDDYLTALFSLDRETRTARSARELLKIAVRMKKGEDISGDIERFIRDYPWLNLEDGYGRLLDKEGILKRLEDMAKGKPEERLRRLADSSADIRKKSLETIDMLKFDDEEKKVYGLMQELIYRRAALNEELNIAGSNLIAFFEELARRLDISYDELFYLIKKELIYCLKENKIPNKKDIKERQKGYSIVLEEGKISFHYGKELDRRTTEKETCNEINEVRGRSACPGFARGPAKIIRSREDIEKIEEGDILVTDSLTPDYILAAGRAQAIIADVGGITSHAAIVSRDLGIPCIIGTKTATTAFRDGELIEVDAKEGVARKS
ncbi:hypothetical protein KY358_05990 [Candidatus Woesearchaeota archaeon]|nr:hypothetical protein [Candidatus Woesearchaeota archaeon]